VTTRCITRTTRQYYRSRDSLNGNAPYIVAAYLA